MHKYYINQKISKLPETWSTVNQYLNSLKLEKSSISAIWPIIRKSNSSFAYLFAASIIFEKIQFLSKDDENNQFKMSNSSKYKSIITSEILVFSVSLIIASKILSDVVFNNACWAELIDHPIENVNLCEKYILDLLKWDFNEIIQIVENKKIFFEEKSSGSIIFQKKRFLFPLCVRNYLYNFFSCFSR